MPTSSTIKQKATSSWPALFQGMESWGGLSSVPVILLAHGNFNASTVAHEIGHQYQHSHFYGGRMHR